MSDSIFTALFPNRFKKEDRHPDFVMKWSKEEGKSTIVLPAGAFELAIWKKKDKNGNDYLSVCFTPVEKKQEEKVPTDYRKSMSEPEKPSHPDDTEIPF